MRQITLNGSWRMREEGELWPEYPAKVPGSVLSALLDAGAIPDPYNGRNEYQARELFRKDYIFWREFQVPEEFLEEEQIDLICMGLDTLARIELNGEEIFYADNMHRRWEIPVKEFLHPGKNQIRIRFLSTLDYINRYRYEEHKTIHYTPCGAMEGNHLIRKAHSMFGWDWGPQLPDAGIFREIFLEGWTGRKILEVMIHQEHHQAEENSGYSAEIQVTVKFSPCKKGQENQKIKIRMTDQDTGEAVADAKENLGDVSYWEGKFTLKNPKLWWPGGYGSQPLYHLDIDLENPDGSLAGRQEKTIGIRTLTVSREKDSYGREFAFVVNGVKIFAMGVNYIPEDCIYSRITKERQEFLLTSAREANFNCIRVWGGGYYPSDDFYELCDRLGLIVWQDLMFACNVYDVTDHFLENCRQEVIDNVKRLRHHPSLGLWCGNNEIESAWGSWEDFPRDNQYLKADYIKLFEYVLPRAVKENDPDTFFWPSSPSSGGCFDRPDLESDGDCHYWDVWHGQKPFTAYRDHYFRFCSEFGFQSFPGLKTIKTFTRPEDRNIFSRVMESHQKNNAANGKILYYLSENFRYPNDFGQLLYVSQILQAMAIQYGVEHWRRNRGRCMGALYWQLNDNWPVASWSSIDYFGRWKALHYAARRFFAPLASSVEIKGETASLFVENETRDLKRWKARLLLRDMNGKILGEKSAKGSTGALVSEKILELDPSAALSAPRKDWEEDVFIEGTVVFEDGTSTQNVETFLPYKYIKLKEPCITVNVTEQEDRFAVCLESDCFAPFVEVELEDGDAMFSDNDFHLTGEGSHTLFADKENLAEPLKNKENFAAALRIRSLVPPRLCLKGSV